jgi:flagellar motor component MotA
MHCPINIKPFQTEQINKKWLNVNGAMHGWLSLDTYIIVFVLVFYIACMKGKYHLLYCMLFFNLRILIAALVTTIFSCQYIEKLKTVWKKFFFVIAYFKNRKSVTYKLISIHSKLWSSERVNSSWSTRQIQNKSY